MTVAEDASNLADLDERELFARLAEELFGEARDVSPGSRDRLRDRGQRWFDGWFRASRDAICADPSVVAVRSEEGATRLQEAAALIDAVSALKSVPPMATAVAILLRRGINQLCGP